MLIRRIAIGLAVSTTVFMAIPIFALISSAGKVISDNWDVYLLFMVFPYSVSALLFLISRKAKSK
jgi:hypothetical protein